MDRDESERGLRASLSDFCDIFGRDAARALLSQMANDLSGVRLTTARALRVGPKGIDDTLALAVMGALFFEDDRRSKFGAAKRVAECLHANPRRALPAGQSPESTTFRLAGKFRATHLQAGWLLATELALDEMEGRIREAIDIQHMPPGPDRDDAVRILRDHLKRLYERMRALEIVKIKTASFLFDIATEEFLSDVRPACRQVIDELKAAMDIIGSAD